MERTRLEQIMKEQNFQAGTAVDESTAVQLGRVLGVRLMVLGAVTEFNVRGISGLSVGNIGLGVQTASAKVSARLVDVQTGEILAAVKGEGNASGGAGAIKVVSVDPAASVATVSESQDEIQVGDVVETE
ncbi:MAG: CsgG/HfaB family protein [Bacillota bacterium]|nr:CsgG/HfaB family protein [Bacillota bacterium]